MPILSCRGAATRERIRRQYHLRPLCHTALIPGQIKVGLTGTLTARYYSFEYVSRTIPTDTGTFFCGYSCGKDFLGLIGHPPISLFDPMAAPPLLGGGAKGAAGAGGPAAVVHPLAEELYRAINLLVAIRNIVPSGGIADTLQYLREYPGRPAPGWRITRFNNYLARVYAASGGTLVSEAAAIPGLKPFAFPLIAAFLIASKATDHVN